MAHCINIEDECIDTGMGSGGYNNSKQDEEVKKLVEFIENDLKQAPTSPNYTIYRVLKPLRQVKPEAYTPRLVSIGPFHRYSIDLWPMEAHKLRLLKRFLGRISQSSLADYVREMKKLENEARQCYSEVIPFKTDEFVRMMVVDSCFILELILGWKKFFRNDPIFNEAWMPQIVRDLMLLENQLPFFVLQKLYMLHMTISDADAIYHVTQEFLQDFLPHSPSITPKASIPQRFCTWVMSIFNSELVLKQESPPGFNSHLELNIDQEESPEESSRGPKPQLPRGGASHLLDYVRYLLVLELPSRHEEMQVQRTHSATELKKATVKFKKSKTTRFSDISFKEGVLRIPAINVDDLTESVLRNLIALEQSHQYDTKYVISYAVFMDDLINSPEDVRLLQVEEIFESLTNLEEVAELFNQLLKEVTQPHDLCFSKVYNEVETYYNNPWRKLLEKFQEHIGSLKNKYFKNPWAFMSFVAATALLGLTIAQTVAAFKYSKKG
ncbi:hypothetical protein NE237_028234 [Protea cynaroides]|uniref:Uncharacterized protein n=1 Tax=Protea cynaroides TaxID=273540 RepID=A0A9Q0GSV4_9MAGN|nr:hypothetical protein NE237_028234 [Protea cynaroides]